MHDNPLFSPLSVLGHRWDIRGAQDGAVYQEPRLQEDGHRRPGAQFNRHFTDLFLIMFGVLFETCLNFYHLPSTEVVPEAVSLMSLNPHVY